MKKIMKKVMTAAVATFAAHLAHATGGYSCRISDKNVDFRIGGVLSHGIPSGPENESGSLKIQTPPLGSTFDIPSISKSTQFWLEGNELNVLIYTEPNTPKFTETLVIKTKYSETKKAYIGTYRLVISPVNEKEIKLTGTVSCETE
jgi:hypothetical protein